MTPTRTQPYSRVRIRMSRPHNSLALYNILGFTHELTRIRIYSQVMRVIRRRLRCLSWSNCALLFGAPQDVDVGPCLYVWFVCVIFAFTGECGVGQFGLIGNVVLLIKRALGQWIRLYSHGICVLVTKCVSSATRKFTKSPEFLMTIKSVCMRGDAFITFVRLQLLCI